MSRRDDNNELVRRIQAGDRAAETELVDANMGFIINVTVEAIRSLECDKSKPVRGCACRTTWRHIVMRASEPRMPRLSIVMCEPSPRGLDAGATLRTASPAARDAADLSQPARAAEGEGQNYADAVVSLCTGFCPTCGARPIGTNANRCGTCLSVSFRIHERRSVLGSIIDITDEAAHSDRHEPGPLVPSPQECVDAAMRRAADEIDAGLGAGGGLFAALAWAVLLVVGAAALIGLVGK